jgi:predicted DNA-binding protein (MmcQ/YjbR family)
LTNPANNIEAAFHALRTYALALPETVEAFPWGECAVKVRGKTVVYLWRKEDRITVTLKLVASHDFALLHPFVNKMGQQLKVGGWVQCRFSAGDTVPQGLLEEWVLQSYCAVAPKRLADTASKGGP